MVCRFQKIDICAEPCIQEIQGNVEAILKRLDLLDKLQDLIEALSGDNAQQEQPEFIEIEVPVAVINRDGSSTLTTATVSSHFMEVDLYKRLFGEVAAARQAINPIDRFTERTYNILGGDRWYQAPVDGDATPVSERRTSPTWEAESAEQLLLLASQSLFNNNQQVLLDRAQPLVARGLTEWLTQLAAVFFHRLSLQDFPAATPQTLLSYSDSQPPLKHHGLGDYLGWMVQQVDALVGQFPIEIEIQDIDPTQPGDQTKKIELPNISEAIAELYPLAIASSTNADLAINFLMRLAAEVIATKNSSLITQDYVKANASFLGYRGNPKNREIDYAFDPTKLDSLENLLNETKGYIQGWEETDPETVVGFLQKIVFSAGIIKTVFFRNQKQFDLLRKEIEQLTEGDKKNDEEVWRKFIEFINDPHSQFNQGNNPQPKIDKEPNTDGTGNQNGRTSK